MDKQRRTLAELETTTPGKVVEISVFYDKGGANMFAGTQEPRGYWLSVQPVTLFMSGGVPCRSFTAFSGVKAFLWESKRYSPKGLEQAVGLAEERRAEVLARVLCKSGLKLKLAGPAFLHEAVPVPQIAQADNAQTPGAA